MLASGGLDGVVNDFDYIARKYVARLQDAAVEASQPPWAIARAGILRKNRGLNARAIPVEVAAGLAKFGDFDNGLTGAETLAGAELATVQAGDREVLAESAGIDRPTEGLDFLDGLLGDEKQGLFWATMGLTVPLNVAEQALSGDLALDDSMFRHPAGRDVELKNAASHAPILASSKVMKIVVTNDDGIDAPGLAALQKVAGRFAEVYVVAPAEEHSAGGHRVTVKGQIRVEPLSRTRFRVHGTPADCVRLALTELVPDAAWVIAGINEGGNLGADVYMSGTVAAAREAALLGTGAVALSHYVRRAMPLDWAMAESRTEMVLGRLLAMAQSAGVYWNVNLPHVVGSVAWRECPLDPSPMNVGYRRDGDAYVYSGSYQDRPRLAGSDVEACFGGAITVTRLLL